MQPSPPVKSLVLVGGGHAHVHVLKAFRDRPEPGVRIVLVSRDARTPYSGMLPGLIAGHYRDDEAHVDLGRLAAACGAAFACGEMSGLDRARKRVTLRDAPPVPYDVLSLDTGSTPSLAADGAGEHALPVKPVEAFLAGLDRFAATARAADRRLRVVVVGGGAGGTETAISLAERFRAALPGGAPDITLLARGRLLPRFNERARRRLRGALDRNGIAVAEGAEARRIEADRIVARDGRVFACDLAIWATWAGAPAWLKDTGLALDERGFVALEPTLRVLNDPSVFAAGDVASVLAHPREKAGVYAVRQGPPLAANLRRALRGEPLRPFTPQATALALIGTGGGRAVAAWGPFALEGRFVWRLKEAIDRRWIRSYQDLRPRGSP